MGGQCASKGIPSMTPFINPLITVTFPLPEFMSPSLCTVPHDANVCVEKVLTVVLNYSLNLI